MKIKFLFESLHGISSICLRCSIIDSKDWQNGADDRRQSYQRWTFSSYNYYIQYDSKVFVKGYYAYKNNVIVGYLPLGKDARFAKIYFISLEQIGMQNAKL